jgi:hypothetical protein
MSRRRLLKLALGALSSAFAACAATPQQQAAALSPTESAIAVRALQSRRFETTDQALMLQAGLGALQDLGFTIEESQAAAGVIVGSKASGAQIRAQVTVRGLPGRSATVVRATFQRIVPRPGAMLPVGETLEDPALYQGFFERVAQSAFLTAHEI